MSRKHTYTGVLVRENGEFVLINNGEDLSLTAELHYFWLKDIPLHITINNDVRTLLDKEGKFYFDRESKSSKYQYYINDINLESVLNSNVNNFIKIEFEETAEGTDL